MLEMYERIIYWLFFKKVRISCARLILLFAVSADKVKTNLYLFFYDISVLI
jgi:hypothetical protein